MMLIVFWSAPGLSHGSHDARLAKLDDQLREEPTNIDLRLQRAHLLMQHGDYTAALTECEAISRVHPLRGEADGMRARIYLELGRSGEALPYATRWSESDPVGAEAQRLLARVLEQLARYADATRVLTHAIELDPAPSPDDFLALSRLRLSSNAEDTDGALSALDGGIARLGPVTSLVLEAIRYLREAGRFDDAIERAAALTAPNGDASLLALRGDLLRDAGRLPEAMVAFSESVSAIEALSVSRRSTPAIQSLRAHVLTELQHLGDRLTTDDGRKEP